MATPAKSAASAAKTVLVTCLKPFTDIKTGITHTPKSKPFEMDEERANLLVKKSVIKLEKA